MINRNRLLIFVLAFAAFPVFAAPAAVTEYEQAKLDMEIRSCVAELGNRADYAGATQVRHEIVVTKRRTVGHKLDIRTSIYSDGSDLAIRTYKARCIVYRDNKPVRFEISETTAGA